MSNDDFYTEEEAIEGGASNGGNGRSPVNATIVIMLVVLALGLAFVAAQLLGGGNGDDATNAIGAEAVNENAVALEAQQNIGITVEVEGEPIRLDPSLGIPSIVVQQQPPAPTATPTQIPPTTDPNTDPNTQPTLEPAVTATPPPTTAPQILPTNPPANIGANPVTFINHTVQAGDTLYGMTRRYATAIALMAMHGIDQDDLIPGAVISIPIGNPAYCLNGLRPYAVDAGETVYAIGQKYNITKEEMLNLNPTTIGADYAIDAGDILCVP